MSRSARPAVRRRKTARANGTTARPPKAPATGAAKSGPPSALIVIADSAPRETCREVLERRGFAVTYAESGVGAVLSARKDPPDLVLMDGDLPDGPGVEAIGWLRCNPALASAPIVLVAAGTDERGADAVLRKPVSPAAVAGALRKVLKRMAKRPAP